MPYETTYYNNRRQNLTALIPQLNLVCWLRADRGIEVDTEKRVVRWLDQSGNGRHLLPEPSMAAPVVENWASRKAVRFDSNSALQVVVLGNPAPVTYTIALVIQKKPGANNVMPAMFGQDTSTANDLWFIHDCFGFNNFNSNIWGINNAEPLVSQPVVVLAEMHSANIEGFRLWLNGQSQIVGPVLGTPVARPLDAFFRLGGSTYLDNGVYWWNGWIAEVLIYDRVLASLEHEQLHAYLLDRYPIPYSDSNNDEAGSETSVDIVIKN